ncbi:MAG: hypothetical protein IKE73_01150 [Bacilli bacterium]|nr:hypothetical protein [Bacilli bacterium]
MENEIKRYEIIEKVLIACAVVIGVITVIDIFLPDPIFLLDEASLAAITGLLTYLSSIVRKKIEELKNGEKKKMDVKEVGEIANKVSTTASIVNKSRKK